MFVAAILWNFFARQNFFNLWNFLAFYLWSTFLCFRRVFLFLRRAFILVGGVRILYLLNFFSFFGNFNFMGFLGHFWFFWLFKFFWFLLDRREILWLVRTGFLRFFLVKFYLLAWRFGSYGKFGFSFRKFGVFGNFGLFFGHRKSFFEKIYFWLLFILN